MPPTRNQSEPMEANIVSELGKEFNIDEVYNGESSYIGSLKSADDITHVEIPSNSPLSFHDNMLQAEAQPQQGTGGGSDQDGEQNNDSDDQIMEAEEEEGGDKKTAVGSRKQNEKLYSEEGMLNTKLKRAEKKRRKKASKSSEMEDEDYDFKVDYKKDSAMDVEDDDDDGDDDTETTYDAKANKFELPEAETGD